MASESVELGVALAHLERARKESFSKLKIWIAVIAVIACSFAWHFHKLGSTPGAVISLVLGAAAGFGLYTFLIGGVMKDFKRKVLPILLKSLDESLLYNDDSFIRMEEFNGSQLFSRPDRYSGKDFVTGTIGETTVRFSMVHAEEEHRESRRGSSDGINHDEIKFTTLFRGLFFVADFNKNFYSSTLVKHKGIDFISKLFGSYVALEDPEFNRLFTVNSTDQVEARYILTPSLMQKFKELFAKVGAFQASFVNGSLFMAIEMPYDAFEPEMTKSLAEVGQRTKILGNLKAIIQIVEDLGLNVRIWTKK